jgi:hypothetical protein
MLYSTIIWRDDYFEIDALQQVGKLYLENKEYAKALDAWQIVSENFKETAENILIISQMKDVFADLFDKGIAYNMPPLEALKIYFKYRDLTPVGEEGDKITRKVSQFFADVDMIDEAIKIVEHQIKFRSQGDEKAKLTLWLVNNLVENRNMDKALDIINNIDIKNMSADIKKELQYKKAEIIASNGGLYEALDLVKNDSSVSADKVRIEVFWQRQNWFGLINLMEKFRIAEVKETVPNNLTKLEVKDITRLAVAYSAQNMVDKLKKLQDDFLKRVDRKDDEKLLIYLTTPRLNLDYKSFDESLQLSTIQDFLKEYSFMPSNDWRSIIEIIAPKLDAWRGKTADELDIDQKKDIVRLALAYAMKKPDDGKEELEIKKSFSSLTRDFKDVRIDRYTIEVFEDLDSKAFPKDNDAVFEGKIKLNEIKEFVDYYKASKKISQLNMSTRNRFKN